MSLRLFYSAGLNDYSGLNPAQADNNGNIHLMDHFVPNALDAGGNITSWVMGTDAYLYDELNRLTQVTETPTGGSGPGFTQKYIYDRWGNRTVNCSPCQTGVTNDTYTIDTATNRITAKNGYAMTYDLAGNQTCDCVGTHYYDTENRMMTVVHLEQLLPL